MGDEEFKDTLNKIRNNLATNDEVDKMIHTLNDDKKKLKKKKYQYYLYLFLLLFPLFAYTVFGAYLLTIIFSIPYFIMCYNLHGVCLDIGELNNVIKKLEGD